MRRQIRIAVTAPHAIIRIMRKSCIEPIAYLPRPQDVKPQTGWMSGPRAGPTFREYSTNTVQAR